MNRNELSKVLLEKGIPRDAYSLVGGLPNECFCLAQNDMWEVYYSERGQKTGLKKFKDEQSACEYLYETIKKVFG